MLRESYRGALFKQLPNWFTECWITFRRCTSIILDVSASTSLSLLRFTFPLRMAQKCSILGWVRASREEGVMAYSPDLQLQDQS